MKFAAILAALALVGACAVQPEHLGDQQAERVSALPFHTQSMVQLRPVDSGSTYMKRLIEHVPVRAVEHDWWTTSDGHKTNDAYLVASSRAELERYVSDAHEPPPADREIALGQTADGWRTYLVSATPAIDGASITHATVAHDADTDRSTLTIDLDPSGAATLHQLTADSVGEKVAILLDHIVIAAPVIQTAITGGRAEISF